MVRKKFFLTEKVVVPIRIGTRRRIGNVKGSSCTEWTHGNAQSEGGRNMKSPQAGREEPGARCVHSETKLKSPGITKIPGVRVKPGARPRGLRVCEVTISRRSCGY